MVDVMAKLDWASALQQRMIDRFAVFASPGGGDERPYGIELRERKKPAGLVTATFIVEEQLPVEMSLLAADCIHNIRVALDHVLARLKDHLGGDPGRGTFPICRTEDEWRERVTRAGRRSSLAGLDDSGVELIYAAQPLHLDQPDNDPLVVISRLDNADKHRLLHPTFVYAGVSEGAELIEILDPGKVRTVRSIWHSGEALEHGTRLAEFLLRGGPRDTLRAHRTVPIGFAWGELGQPEAHIADMISRVRTIAQDGEDLLRRR